MVLNETYAYRRILRSNNTVLQDQKVYKLRIITLSILVNYCQGRESTITTPLFQDVDLLNRG